MLSSLARYLEHLPEEEGDPFLTQIQALFHSDFIAKQQTSDQEEGEALNMSPRRVDSDDITFNQLMSQEQPLEGGGDSASDNCAQPTTSETDSSTVLHLGSVLSTKHDFLLGLDNIT